MRVRGESVAIVFELLVSGIGQTCRGCAGAAELLMLSEHSVCGRFDKLSVRMWKITCLFAEDEVVAVAWLERCIDMLVLEWTSASRSESAIAPRRQSGFHP